MIQSHYFQDNPDLQAHFERFIDWNEVVPLYENAFEDAVEYDSTGNERLEFAPRSVEEAVESYRQVVESYGDLCGNEMSQLASEMDRQGLTFKAGRVTHPEPFVRFFEKFHEAGLHATSFRRKFGGFGMPHTAKALTQEISYRADSSLTIAVGSVSLAGILEMYAEQSMQDEWIPRMLENKYVVTMGLSEADFGSDLPNIRTRAEQRDGQWFLSGTKRFQTMACGVNQHPSAVLTLARSGDPQSGARGLSFFLMEGKHVEITGIEKKLGLKASATCETAFENAPAHLIGHEGHGLSRYVIGMLNGARLSVASQGTGIATAAYYEARKYARARIQFGRPIIEIPAVNRMLRRMEREIAAMRCLMIEAARSVDRYHWKVLRLKESGDRDRAIKADPEIRRWEKLAGAITPMSKYYNAEMCNSLVYDALQVLGGAGYIEEYDLARLYRDARITNIYDGTTQIQVNAAIGGVVSGMSATGYFRSYLEGIMARIPTTAESREMFDRLDRVISLYRELQGSAKEAHAFEVVETATRLLNGLLLEETAQRTSGDEARERRALAHEYAVDSLGLAGAAELRLRDVGTRSFVVV